MNKPWKEVRKCVVYDHIPNSSAVLCNGASVIFRILVMPSNGISTMAARTAFLTCSMSLEWLCRSLTTNTRIIFNKNMKFNSKTAKRGPSNIQ